MDFLKQNNFRYIVIIIIIIISVINLCKVNSQENFIVLDDDQDLGGNTVKINSTDQVMFGSKTLTQKLKNVETGLLTLGTDPTGPPGILDGANGLHLRSNRDVFLMSPPDNVTRVAKDWGNSGKLVVEGRADFMAGAYVEGHLTSKVDSNEGGRLSLKNPKKYSDNTKVANWIIYNMTGDYSPNGLHFWRESGHTALHNNHINKGSSFVLTDDGDTLVKGNLTVNGSNNIMPDLSVISYAGSVVPAGWQLCDGNYLRYIDGTVINDENQKYANLRKSGTTVHTPDLRGRFILGSGKAGENNNNSYKGDSDGKDAGYGGEVYNNGGTGGCQKQQLSVAQMPEHNHNVKLRIGCTGNTHGACNLPRGSHKNTLSNIGTDTDWRPEWHNWEYSENRSGYGTGLTQDNSGSSAPHTNMPPYYILTYIIKQPSS